MTSKTSPIVVLNTKRKRVSTTEIISFPVGVYPLAFADSSVASKINGDLGVSVVREDTGNIICHASSSYQLLSHTHVLNVIEEVLKVNNVNFEVFDVHTGGTQGNKMYVNYAFPELSFDIEGDPYFPFLQVANSYDKSLLFSVRYGLYRSACSNGLLLGVRDTTFVRSKHVNDNIDLSNVAFNLNNFLEKFSSYGNRLSNLMHQGLPENFINDAVNKVFLAKRDRQIFLDSPLLKEHLAEFGNTKYAVLNAFTNYITHALPQFSNNYDWSVTAQHKVNELFFN